MKALTMKEQVRDALDRELSSLQTSSAQRDRLIETAMEGRKMYKKKMPLAFVLALILSLLLAGGALAAALLSGQQIVEEMAVPMAQSSRQENYTHEELENLIRTLNENGITLDEGSTMMQAFRAGHGYWERDTIEEICKAAFGGNEYEWSVEQQHWYGEMMVEIGAWDENLNLLPGDGDMTVPEARALAAEILENAYGVKLPSESDGEWKINESFCLTYLYEDSDIPTPRAEWRFGFENRRTGSVDYDASFGRDGGGAAAWRAPYLESTDAKDWVSVMDDLENRDGSCTNWDVETWAEFGEKIKDCDPGGRSGWLYQHAGYRLPPEGAVSPDEAKEIALKEMNYGEITGKVYDHVICCTDGDRPIYKVNHRVILRAEDLQRSGKYDAVWCLEIDCMTGQVLEKRAYAYGPDADPMMLYVPFSLLDQAPAAVSPAGITARQRVMERAQKEEQAILEYGENLYFWPMDVKLAVYGEPYAQPSRAEYDRALEIARQAVADRYGPDALEKLGDYQVGFLHRRFDDEKENGCWQLDWDFMFTTDPEFLSDGYRVQFVQLLNTDGREKNVEWSVEMANMGNG